MNLKMMLAVAAAAGALAGGVAHADPITGLFNTGVDGAGTPLANHAAEQHWVLVGGPTARTSTQANGYPNTVWLPDDAFSDWIGPDSDSQLDGPVANSDYQLTFSLSGLDAASASISGRYAVDDTGVDIFINGIGQGQTAAFNSWTNFSITSGFQAGVNVLDFRIHNLGGPTGVRVELSGTARAVDGVPEPATWAMMLVGFGGLGAVLRRRRSAGALAA